MGALVLFGVLQYRDLNNGETGLDWRDTGH